MLAMAAVAACEPAGKNLPAELDESYAPVSISAKVDAVQPGTTAVPDYIKTLPDYHETYYENEDGPTWYADWTNAELQWFTKQFYADFH